MVRAERGFTLIEMVVVIIVVAVVASITIPRAIKVSPAQEVDRAARTLMRDLELARMRAMASKRQVRVHFYDSERFYAAFMDMTPERLGVIAETEDEVRAARMMTRGSSGGIPGVELPRGVEFGTGSVSTGPDGASTAEAIDLENDYVEFDPRGMVDPEGVGGVIYLVHEEDPDAVAAVTISGASAFRAWRHITGEWIS